MLRPATYDSRRFRDRALVSGPFGPMTVALLHPDGRNTLMQGGQIQWNNQVGLHDGQPCTAT